MRKLIVLGSLIALLWLACQKTPVQTSGPEVFAGRLVVHRTLEAYPFTFIDTDQVSLAIDAGSYELTHPTRNSDLCDSYGVIQHFGTNTLTLLPSGANFDGSCDQLRIPSGAFQVVFKSDSLLIGPDTLEVVTTVNGTTARDTMVFFFQLTLR